MWMKQLFSTTYSQLVENFLKMCVKKAFTVVMNMTINAFYVQSVIPSFPHTKNDIPMFLLLYYLVNYY